MVCSLDSPSSANVDAMLQTISELGSAVYVGNSVFFVSSTLTAHQAFCKLQATISGSGVLFVVDAKNNTAAWQGLPEVSANALKQLWAS